MIAGDLRRTYASARTFWTWNVNQRLAAAIARPCLRRGIPPNRLSVGNALVGIATGCAVVLLGGTGVLAGVVAFVGWQLAFALDCADGQVARAAGTSSADGGVIDAVGDFVAQSSLLMAVIWGLDHSLEGGLDPTLAALLFAAWITAPYYAGLMHDVERPANQGTSLIRRLVVESRDYGLHILLLSLLMIVRPEWMLWDLVFCAIFSLVLLIRVMWHAWTSGTTQTDP